MNRRTQRLVGGFRVHTVANDQVSLSLVPELGGRVVSLRDKRSGREWLDGWFPAKSRRIGRPTDPRRFETGPGAGLDECLPTVLPCKFMGKELPDHGELWNRPPEFEVSPDNGGTMICRWRLNMLPLEFERRISMGNEVIRCDYRLRNLASSPTPFLWAWHPLFSWKPGDQILTTEKSCHATHGERPAWPHIQPGCDLSRAEFPEGTTPAAKVFLGPLTKGHAAIKAANGAVLKLEWPAKLFPYAGIWITRGFWKGLHHWAIEPTNAPVDRLSDVEGFDSVNLLVADEIRRWTVRIKLQST